MPPPSPPGAARYDTMRSYLLTMLHGAPTGRLLVHNPADGSTRQLADGFWFANGCALAHDESFVAVRHRQGGRPPGHGVFGCSRCQLLGVPCSGCWPG